MPDPDPQDRLSRQPRPGPAPESQVTAAPANGHSCAPDPEPAIRLFSPLPPGRFDILYADPPWDYKGQQQHAGPASRATGGAIRHFPTLPLDQLRTLAVQSLAADNSLLFLWATSPHLDQAIDLGKAWGFAWATVAFVWDKERVNPGHYTLSQCELCLVFKRGRIPRPRGARNVRQLLRQRRGPHSAKPDAVRERISAMFPQQRKIELFARQVSPGWYAWGLDVTAPQPGAPASRRA